MTAREVEPPAAREVFRPRGSIGLASLLVTAAAVALPPIGAAASTPALPAEARMILLAPALIALPFVVLAAWFPTMAYELDARELVLRYGPHRYRIPLADIVELRHADLSITVWSSLRLPGLALFRVPYADVGVVHMCATRVADAILLIRTRDRQYGITPADESAFVRALTARLPR